MAYKKFNVSLDVEGSVKTDKVQLNTASTNTLEEGEFGWNSHDKTIDLKSGAATLQLNQEQVLPIKNNTGSTLLDGRLVRITGYDNINDYYLVSLSDNSLESTAFVDFMLTQTLLDGEVGLGTKFGLVHDLNTTGGTQGNPVYLGASGQFTPTLPTYPNKAVVIGTYGNIDAAAGDIFVELNKSSQYIINTITNELELKAMQNPGICQKCPILPIDIVIDTTALTLTIATIKGGEAISAANPVRFFTDGAGIITKWEKTSPVVFPAFTNTNGPWYFYFNNSGEPVTTQSIWTEFATIATVYRIYWNSTLTGADRLVSEAFEAHINDISSSDHSWKHAQGSIYESGLDLVHNVLPTGSPNVDGRNTVISLTSGRCSDDGLEWTVTNTDTPTNYFEQDLGNIVSASLTSTNSALFKVRYTNASGLLSFLPATRFPFLWSITTNRPQYITSTGVVTEVPDDNWFVYYVYNLSERRPGNAIKITSAEVPFTSLANAQAHSWETMRSLYASIKDNEIRPLYKLIFYTNYTNPAPYAVACKYTVLKEFVDIRTQKTSSTVAGAASTIASNVIFTPTGNVASTNVQSAITELDSEKQPNITLTTTGTSGAATLIGSTLNIPQYVLTGVTSVDMTVPVGLSVSGNPVTSSGTLAVTYAAGYSIPTTVKQGEWDTAYSERNNWSGGSTNLVAATGRTSLGATTVGSNIFTATNPSAISFLRANADNTVSFLDGANFRTAIGAGTVTSVAALTIGTAGTDLSSTVANTASAPVITLNVPTASATNRGALSAADWTTFNNKTSNLGTVTSVAMTVPTGLTVSGTPISTSGTLALALQSGYSIPTTASQTNWDTAYTDRNKWDGGSTGLTAATGRTSLGATTLGSNLFTITNPSAISFPRFNADNTVTALDAASFRTAIGAGTSSTSGTVTSVSVISANGISGSVATSTTTPAITLTLGAITPTSVAATGTITGSNLSGTNTGDQTNISGSAGSFTGSLGGDVTGTQGATTVGRINGTSLAGLGTGILKNTTGTGVPSIAIAADFPILNQNTTGTASTITGIYSGTLTSSQVTTALTYTPYNATNPSGFTSNTGTVTSVTAGNGLTQSGTASVNPTLTIVSHAGSAGTIGTINIGTDAIGVNLGSTSTTACAGNDSRLSDARIASDVYSWAKAATKPAYTYTEVGAAPSSTVSFPGFGTTGSLACVGNDSRLSDVRTPAANLGSNLALNAFNINFTATLASNSTYSGYYETGTVGENVVFGDVLYLKFSDGKWWKAKADSYTTTPAARMAMASISANASGNLLIEGNVRYDSWSLAANKVYLSAATAGAVTTTQPSTTGNQIQVIGIAKTSTKMYFRPSYDVGEK